MRLLAAVLMSLLCVPATVSWAATLERSLPVSVWINANQGASGLEIVADNYMLQANYDASIDTFSPLPISFRVRSVSGQSIAYDLFMSQLGGRCDGQPHVLTVTSKVGGESILLNEKHRFAGVENEHGVVISFPVIPQSDVAQQCEGYIGVIAELFV